MTAKEYLSQAYHIDQRINCKLEQVRSLRDLATKTGAVLSDMPRSRTRNIHRMDGIISKMVDLEDEISTDIDGLLELKQEIAETIGRIGNPTYRILLELRYLCFKTWDEIAVELNYERRYIHKVHDKAVKQVDTKRQ